MSRIKPTNVAMDLDKIDSRETNPALLGPMKQPVRKLPFRLSDLEFYDSTYICDPLTGKGLPTFDDDGSDNEDWDAPLRRTKNVSSHIINTSRSPSRLNPHTDEEYQR